MQTEIKNSDTKKNDIKKLTKMPKRMLALLLVFLMVITTLPITASASTNSSSSSSTSESDTADDDMDDAIAVTIDDDGNVIYEDSDTEEDYSVDADTEDSDSTSDDIDTESDTDIEESIEDYTDSDDVEVDEERGIYKKTIDTDDVVDSSTISNDPAIENYIKENADSQYVTLSDDYFFIDNILLVKNSIFDGRLVDSSDTLESFNENVGTDEGFTNEALKLVATVPTYVAVYDVDADSDYFVAYANTMMDSARVQDYIFANNNNNGEVLDDCIYDSDTGLAYIPKDDYVEDDEYIYCGIQIQLMQVYGNNKNSEDEILNCTDTVQYNVSEDNATEVDVYEETASIFALQTNFQLDTDLDVDDMDVMLNGVPVNDNIWSYDSNTGILNVSYSSASIQSISVTLDHVTIFEKIFNSIKTALGKVSALLIKIFPSLENFSALKTLTARAATIDSSNYNIVMTDFDLGLDDGVGVGDYELGQAAVWYTSNYSALKAQAYYGYFYWDTSLTDGGFSTYLNWSSSSNIDISSLSYKNAWNDFCVKTNTFTKSSGKTIPSLTDMGWLVMKCMDIGSASSSIRTQLGSNISGTIGVHTGVNVKVNVLYITPDGEEDSDGYKYAILGFFTQEIGNQNGYGLFIVRLKKDEESSKIKIEAKKRDAFSGKLLDGAEFSLYNEDDIDVTLGNMVDESTGTDIGKGEYTGETVSISSSYGKPIAVGKTGESTKNGNPCLFTKADQGIVIFQKGIYKYKGNYYKFWLPAGKYYLKETKAPDDSTASQYASDTAPGVGYAYYDLSDMKLEVDASQETYQDKYGESIPDGTIFTFSNNYAYSNYTSNHSVYKDGAGDYTGAMQAYFSQGKKSGAWVYNSDDYDSYIDYLGNFSSTGYFAIGDTSTLSGETSATNGTVFNGIYSGVIVVRKTDEFGKPKKGVTLSLVANRKITSPTGKTLYAKGTIIDTETTDSNGYVVFGGKADYDDGNGYALPCTVGEDYCGTAYYTNSNGECTIETSYGYKIKEVDADNNNSTPDGYQSLGDVAYADIVYPSNGYKKTLSELSNNTKYHDGYYDRDNGVMVAGLIDPQGYITGKVVYANADGGISSDSIVNYHKINLVVPKVDNHGQDVDGARFALYYGGVDEDDNNYWNYDTALSDTDYDSYDKNINGGDYVTRAETKNGYATFTDLNYGIYYLKEISNGSAFQDPGQNGETTFWTIDLTQSSILGGIKKSEKDDLSDTTHLSYDSESNTLTYTITSTITNYLYANVRVIKVDEFGNKVGKYDAKWALYDNDEDAKNDTDGSLAYVNQHGDGVSCYKATDENGEILFSYLPYGTYYLKEISNADNYQDPNGTVYPLTLSKDTVDWDDTVELDVYETKEKTNYHKIELKIVKEDEYDNTINGAAYALFNGDYWNEENVKNLTDDEIYDILNNQQDDLYGDEGYNTYFTKAESDSEGLIMFKDLNFGTYYLRELYVPAEYLVSDTVYTVDLTKNTIINGIENGTYALSDESSPEVVVYAKSLNIEPKDDEPTGELTLIKTDSVTGNEAHIDGFEEAQHGDALLAGTTYTMYASDDIYNAAGTDKLFSAKDEIASWTFDDTGKYADINILADISTIKNVPSMYVANDGTYTSASDNEYTDIPVLHGIPMGTYYIKETNASDGYYNDEYIYEITFTYKATFESNDYNVYSSLTVTDSDGNTVSEYPDGFNWKTTAYSTDIQPYDLAERYAELTVADNVLQGWFRLNKTSDNDGGLQEAVHNAEFTAILASYVDKYKENHPNADITEIIASISSSGLADDEYSIFYETGEYSVDDIQAIYKSGMLAYGTYYVYETHAPTSGETDDGTAYSPVQVFTVTIEECSHDGASDKEFDAVFTQGTTTNTVCGANMPYTLITLTDKPVQARIKITKIDADTGDLMSYNGAIFELRKVNSDGTETTVSQNVGSSPVAKFGVHAWSYDVFDVDTGTYTEHGDDDGYLYIGNNDTRGTVWTPLTLEYGTYRLYEKSIPYGYIAPDTYVEFTLDENTPLALDGTGEYYIDVIAENHTVSTKVTVEKSLNTRDDVDTSVVDTDLSNVIFELTANETIVDSATGDPLVEAQGPVHLVYDSAGVYHFDRENPDNGTTEINPDSEGNLTINDLPLGEYDSVDTYTLAEIKTVDGGVIVKDDDENDLVYPFTLTQTNLDTDTIKVDFNVENDTTVTYFYKEDAAGSKEVPGATLTVTDKDGNVIDRWVSGETAHSIEGLIVGETYTLTEELTPGGFVTATPIEFTVQDTADPQYVYMKDKVEEFTKTDCNGNIIEGATMTVTDSEGNVVDTFTTGETIFDMKYNMADKGDN